MDTNLTTSCSCLETFSGSCHFKIETQILIWLVRLFVRGPLPQPSLFSGHDRAGLCPLPQPHLYTSSPPPSWKPVLAPLWGCFPSCLTQPGCTDTRCPGHMHTGASTLATPHLGVHGQVLMDKHRRVVAGAGNMVIQAPTDHMQTHGGFAHTHTQHCSGGKACGRA